LFWLNAARDSINDRVSSLNCWCTLKNMNEDFLMIVIQDKKNYF
jgi:hypothetical protein